MPSPCRDNPSAPLEIERKYLLRAMPVLPPGATPQQIEQGYLAGEGRLRRTTLADGRIVCHYTVKRGTGLVREEHESEIPRHEFDRQWPETVGRRLRKTRYRIVEGNRVWEIDCFDEPRGLVFAEVELPDPDATAEIPPWLAPVVIREVTDDPGFSNRAIAVRLGAGRVAGPAVSFDERAR